ncbi:MAG: FtsW/RodA/SpoVE family cell cycle protein [Prevotellaceae bacterium]|nr:FtsW/RodA/SpoVE family cell cycle protein [Prevotellaceae bacterium]
MFGLTKKKGWLRGDMAIWSILIMLCLISIVEVYSASSNMSYSNGKYWSPVIQHSFLLCLALALAWLTHITNLGIIKLALFLLYPVSLILLVVVLITGRDVNGAARFIPVLGITFQPSELAKLCLIGAASLILSIGYDKEKRQTGKKYFWWLIGFTLLTCALIFTENLSTAVIIALVMVVLAWIASPPRKLFYGVCLGVGALALAGYLGLKSVPDDMSERLQGTSLHRYATWIHRVKSHTKLPKDPQDYDIYENVQVTHAHIAVATGGLLKGRGIGQSVERDFLPQAYSDFIYAIIIEEGGLIWGIVVMALYLLLLYRCIRIARRCKNKYPAYLVMGIGLMLVTQAMVNMAVAVGAMPVTGQTLPLISKGGTSVLISGISIGIILKVSYGAKRIETYTTPEGLKRDSRGFSEAIPTEQSVTGEGLNEATPEMPEPLTV